MGEGTQDFNCTNRLQAEEGGEGVFFGGGGTQCAEDGGTDRSPAGLST